MAGFLSKEQLSINRFEEKRQQLLFSGKEICDLTETNPTKAGLLFPQAILEEASKNYFSERVYEPDPKGLPDARNAVAQYYKERTPSLRIDPDNIVITASTSEAYRLLFSLLCDAGDNVLSPDITYPLFDLLAEDQRIHCETFGLDASNGWTVDGGSLLHARTKRSRAVLLVSPHNPTGAVIREPVPALTALDLPLIADEVFSEFGWAEPPPPLGSVHPELPVFHLNGISKMLALPDLKLGWIAMNDAAAERFAARLEILNDLYLSANQLSQTMLPVLLGRRAEFLSTMRSRLESNIRLALDLLEKHPAVTVKAPEAAPFLFPEIRTEADEEHLVFALLEDGIITHPGYFYGCETGNRVMISCVNHPDVLQRGIEGLLRRLR